MLTFEKRSFVFPRSGRNHHRHKHSLCCENYFIHNFGLGKMYSQLHLTRVKSKMAYLRKVFRREAMLCSKLLSKRKQWRLENNEKYHLRARQFSRITKFAGRPLSLFCSSKTILAQTPAESGTSTDSEFMVIKKDCSKN